MVFYDVGGEVEGALYPGGEFLLIPPYACVYGRCAGVEVESVAFIVAEVGNGEECLLVPIVKVVDELLLGL